MLRSSAVLVSASPQTIANPTAQMAAYVREARHVSSYKWAEVHLNGDGQAEQFVYATYSDFCGSGGCTLFVLQRQPVGYRVILRSTVTQLPIRLFATSSHGWRDLAVGVPRGLRPRP